MQEKRTHTRMTTYAEPPGSLLAINCFIAVYTIRVYMFKKNLFAQLHVKREIPPASMYISFYYNVAAAAGLMVLVSIILLASKNIIV